MQMAKRNFLLSGLFLPILAFLTIISLASTSNLYAVDLTAEVVAGGFDNPIYLESPPGDTSRLFIIEQDGLIKIIKNGSVLATPFLDISGSVSGGNEQGLLGLAFHPDYSSNGYFYINYTATNGDTRLARCEVSANPDVADAGSLTTLLTVPQPFSNHNAGMLAFSPIDGYLYMGLGDGGSGGDPNNNAQDSTVLLGKMLRIDVDGTFPYGIPADNPFVSIDTIPDEIWAVGLRNPWRYSFDRETGALYIADVGQGEWEEINYQPDGIAGVNYGWRLKEGTHCYNPSMNCDLGGLTDPIYEYPHGSECSISGGYVYRGEAIPELQGFYLYGDYCSGTIWAAAQDDESGEWRSAAVIVFGRRISSFGEDAAGNVYVLDHGGEIFELVAAQ